ncbi:hypothetical protein, partial [Pelomonas sp. KK5]|uniref:hypothetical protein n=1 Tax=Pelomonas sp. KK5 TaxID=1855730 RepID=UPI001E52C964
RSSSRRLTARLNAIVRPHKQQMALFLPFESAILGAVGSSLSDDLRGPFLEQMASINKVQRLLDWKEIEFYCMRWFKVRWPSNVLFDRREEFVLASGSLTAGAATATVKIWAVGGHVFSVESESSMKPFRSTENLSFVVAHAA